MGFMVPSESGTVCPLTPASLGVSDSDGVLSLREAPGWGHVGDPVKGGLRAVGVGGWYWTLPCCPGRDLVCPWAHGWRRRGAVEVGKGLARAADPAPCLL